jgi:hypothetical protein
MGQTEAYRVSAGRDPRGLPVQAGDGAAVGNIVDMWIDEPEQLVRYLEVELFADFGGGRRLIPMPLAVIKPDRVTVRSIYGKQFAGVPTTKAADVVTKLEEDKIWFVLLALWRGLAAGEGVMGVLGAGVPLLLLGAAAVVILWGVAWVMARAAVYTLTNRRVVMRIGAALQVTFNLPFKQIETASLDLRKGGTGTIALRLTEGSKIAYLVAWPHVRPWHMARTEPALRCIPDAGRVAALIAETAESQLAQPVLSRDGGDAAAKLAAE